MPARVATVDAPVIGAVLIKLCDIIASQEINIMNDLHAIDSLDNLKLTNKDVKQIFYFHIINGICEYIDRSTHSKSHVLYYSSCDLKFLELTEYIENFKLKQFLDTLTKHVTSNLPVKFYTSNICFDQFEHNSNTGLIQQHVHLIKNKLNKRSDKIDTSRTRNYLTNKGFNYLHEKYFTKYKQMMFFYK